MTLVDVDSAKIPRRLPVTIKISPRLITAAWARPQDYPFVRVAAPSEGHGSDGHAVGEHGCYAPAGSICANGWVVTFQGAGDDQLFLVRGYDDNLGTWVASWPD